MNIQNAAYVQVLHPVSSVSANSDSAALDLSAYEGPVAIILDCGAASAGDTLACKIQDCDTSAGSYGDVAGGGFTTVDENAASTQVIYVNSDECKRYIKLNKVVTGSTVAVLCSAVVIGKKKYI